MLINVSTCKFQRSLHEHHRKYDRRGSARLPNRKYWRSRSMALSWAGTLPLLKAALVTRKTKADSPNEHLVQTAKAA
jgi:hypothetical protein